MTEFDRRIARVLLLVVLVAPGLVGVACSREPGEPRPAPSSATSPRSTTGSTTAVQSVRDLDLCTLLTPEDFPVAVVPGKEPLKFEDPNAGCSWTISVDNVGGTFSAGVSRRSVPFSRFVPPPDSPNGRSTEIAGRQAWLGNPLPDVDKGCSAAFGAADGTLMASVTDETGRGVDPCQTVTELAEIAISRTPSPTE